MFIQCFVDVGLVSRRTTINPALGQHFVLVGYAYCALLVHDLSCDVLTDICVMQRSNINDIEV